jgi:hypothetical protein
MGMSHLSRSDRLALVFFFASVCLAFLAWAFPNVSRVVTIPGAILSFCFMLYFLWPEIQTIYSVRRHRMIPLFGMAISTISFTMFAVWYFWPTNIGPMIAPSAKPIESHIYVACQIGFLPWAMPQEGKFYLLLLSPSELAKGGGYIVIEERIGQPGSAIQWPSKGFQNMGARCEIVNYTKQTLLNINIQVKIQFASTDDKKEFDGEWRIILQKLDDGVSNKFVFFMKNEEKTTHNL